MNNRGYMYEMGDIKLNALWFADDNTMIEGSVEAAEYNIKLMKEVAGKFGLEINEYKRKIVIPKGGKGITKIAGINLGS